MTDMQKQRGISLIGGLIILIVVGFVGLMVVRLFPVYYQYFVVSSVLNDVKDSGRGQSPADIRNTILKRFNVNEVHVVSIRDVKIIAAKDGGTDVSVHYDDSVPFLANLSLVATFDKHVEVPSG
jgi:hypothetical protein